MIGNCRIVNPEAALKFVTEMYACKSITLHSKDFELGFTDIQPDKEYEKPQNKKTGFVYPNCCDYHTRMFEAITKWFDSFPNCCDTHKKLLSQKWFNKKQYYGVESKLLNQISYSEYHILNKINKEDWFEDIEEYIEANILSFGQLPEGFGVVGLDLYLFYVENFIEHGLNDYSEKKDKLLIFIREINNENPKKKREESDLNKLKHTYNRWLKLMPFSLPYLKEKEKEYRESIPLLNAKPRINRYTNLVSVSLVSQSKLISLLNIETQKLIQLFNASELISAGISNEINSYQIEIENRLLQIGVSKLTEAFDNEELKYVEVLNKWYKLHRKYFSKIKPLISSQESSASPNFDKKEKTPKRTTQSVIEEYFEVIHNSQGWRYAFRSKDDYRIFVDLLVCFFEQKEYTTPANIIRLNTQTKTKVGNTLHVIYKELSEAPLKSNIQFLSLLKCLSHFSNLTENEIYKVLTK
ncbi:MAG: hypothetical protein MUC87_02215 [Bacteroidia bacterium]|jgi:hypothetical protein|nr:hypothetical protein [Bacteroidia bacterium]